MTNLDELMKAALKDALTPESKERALMEIERLRSALASSREEVERLRGLLDAEEREEHRLIRERDEAQAEVERLTEERDALEQALRRIVSTYPPMGMGDETRAAWLAARQALIDATHKEKAEETR